LELTLFSMVRDQERLESAAMHCGPPGLQSRSNSSGASLCGTLCVCVSLCVSLSVSGALVFVLPLALRANVLSLFHCACIVFIVLAVWCSCEKLMKLWLAPRNWPAALMHCRSVGEIILMSYSWQNFSAPP